MARLLTDENIHPELIELLRAHGHDVATAASLDLIGAMDERVLESANLEDRILVTADKDFGMILEFGPLSGRGRVLLLRYALLNWARIARDVCEVLTLVKADYGGDARLLVVLSEGIYRLRHTSAPGP